MTDDAFEAALRHRTADDPVYLPQLVGPQVFAAAQTSAAQRSLGGVTPSDSGGAGVPPPGLPPLGGGVMGPLPLGNTPSTAGLPPPDPLDLPGTPDLMLDEGAIERALGGVQRGPTLDDFQRHGTLPGFGDAQQDPYGVALRRHLTALIRSA